MLLRDDAVELQSSDPPERAYAVTFNATVAGDVEDFDSDAFRVALVGTLSLQTVFDVNLRVSPGSVLVQVQVSVETKEDADALASELMPYAEDVADGVGQIGTV